MNFVKRNNPYVTQRACAYENDDVSGNLML